MIIHYLTVMADWNVTKVSAQVAVGNINCCRKFLPRYAVHSIVRTVLSQDVCMSLTRVTCWYCVSTAELILRHFLPSGSHTNGNPLTGALNAKEV